MHMMLAIMVVFLPGWARNVAADAHVLAVIYS